MIVSKLGYILTIIDNKHWKYNNIERKKEIKTKNSSDLKNNWWVVIKILLKWWDLKTITYYDLMKIDDK